MKQNAEILSSNPVLTFRTASLLFIEGDFSPIINPSVSVAPFREPILGHTSVSLVSENANGIKDGFLIGKVMPLFGYIQAIKVLAFQSAIAYLPNLVLLLVPPTYFFRFSTVTTALQRAGSPSSLTASTIDYTGKSGFIEIKAPAFE